MYISSNIATRIKKLAKSKGVVIKDMLSECGLGANTMANLKTSMPKADSLAKIADFLGCSVDYLLGRTDNYISENSQSKITKQEFEVLLAYRKNPNMQTAVNRLLGVEPLPMKAIKIARSDNSQVTEIVGDFSDIINAPETDEDL